MRILVVEDDKRIASFIRRGLHEEQYAVDVAADGEQGLYLAQTNDYDLLILDVVLPKRTGLEILQMLRQERVATPILMLTAKSQTEDKIKGLDAGADDYLGKPFDFNELLARVRTLLRRRGDLIPTVLRAGDLELDVIHHRATRGSQELSLTSREFSLLEYLLRHQNEVVTRSMLAEHVWEQDFDSFSNVINVHVARLRQKVDQGAAPVLLHTIRGRGYMLKAPAARPAKSARRPA